MTITTQKIIETALETLDKKLELVYGCTDLSNEDYHADKSYISRSAILDFMKSPYTYWAKHLNPDRPKKEPTDAMILGSAFHTLILEPNLFDETYLVKPEAVYLKVVGRKQFDDYKKLLEKYENSNKILLTAETGRTLAFMQNKLLFSPEAVELIKNARIENSFFWQDKDSGLLLKCRPDALHDNIIVDLKTCNDASPRAFQNSMMAGGYHIQGAMIRDGVEAIEGRRINNVINICVETKYPYNMGIYIIDEFALEEGERKYKQICMELKELRETNVYQDYGVQTISLPKWAF